MRKYPRKIPTLFLFTTPLSLPHPHSSPGTLSLPLLSLTPPLPTSSPYPSLLAAAVVTATVSSSSPSLLLSPLLPLDGGGALKQQGRVEEACEGTDPTAAAVARADPTAATLHPRSNDGSGGGEGWLHRLCGSDSGHPPPAWWRRIRRRRLRRERANLAAPSPLPHSRRRQRLQATTVKMTAAASRVRVSPFLVFFLFSIFAYKRCKHPHAKIGLSRAGAPPHVKIVIFTYHLVCAYHPVACENRDWIIWKNWICSSVNSSTPHYVQLSLSCCKHIFLRKYTRYHFLILL